MGLQDIAFSQLNRVLNGTARQTGFGPELSRLAKLSQELDPDELRDVFPYRADGFVKVSQHQQIYLIAIEIEDTHKLRREKLKAYSDLWFAFDATMRLNFGLIVTDRYGRASTIDLEEMFYSFSGGPVGRVFTYPVTPAPEGITRESLGHVPCLSFDEIVTLSKRRRAVPVAA